MDEDKMQRHMEFLLEWQAQFAAELGELRENDKRSRENITRLEGVVEQLGGVVERVVGIVERVAANVERVAVNVEQLAQSTRERLEAVDRRDDETDRKIGALVDSQIQTEESIRNLGAALDRHLAEGHKGTKEEPEG
jgi:hypothetical protein